MRRKTLESYIRDAKTVAIVGHVQPDGDCLGSLTAAYRYLTENRKDLSVTLFAEGIAGYLQFLLGDVRYEEGTGEGRVFDLAIALDTAAPDRLGAGSQAFFNAGRTLVIDHHRTNPGFGTENVIRPAASSAAEVLYGLLEKEKISLSTAEKLYTGIIQDSGVFRYKCTSPKTLRVAAALMEKGVGFTRIIEESVINQDYKEMLLTARVLETCRLYPEEQFIFGKAPRALQQEFGLEPMHLGNVVVELNNVREANVAFFAYELPDGSWKTSLRAKCDLNVAEIAERFGGGGHLRAAGFSFRGDPDEMGEKIREIVRSKRKP